jgi:predicted signal transduction protein with EAL and GGDEF domain
MAALGERSRPSDQSLGPVRVVALAVAALVASSMVLIVQHARGALNEVPVIAAACAALFHLTLARLVTVASEQRRLATTDSLTGLYTRRFFEAHTPPAASTHPVALLVIDIDHFKSINDRAPGRGPSPGRGRRSAETSGRRGRRPRPLRRRGVRPARRTASTT